VPPARRWQYTRCSCPPLDTGLARGDRERPTRRQPAKIGSHDDSRQLPRPSRGHARRRPHGYIAYYPDHETVLRRVGELLSRSIEEASSLPDGERHTLIVACMAATYLSKDSARTKAIRRHTHVLIDAGGLLPILRLWRFAYASALNLTQRKARNAIYILTLTPDAAAGASPYRAPTRHSSDRRVSPAPD
jgi:hypothetical protein